MKNARIAGEVFGWYGVIAILTAYAGANLGWMEIHSLPYQLLNITGGLGILIDAYQQKNYQPVVLNLIWIIIAIVAIMR